MFSTAEKTTKPATTLQRKAEGASFFGKVRATEAPVSSTPFFAPTIQPKLGVSTPGDAYKTEANTTDNNFGNIDVHSGSSRSAGPIRIQPKLTINQPGDEYEQEADAVAEKVMRMRDTETLQTKPSPIHIQRKCTACEEGEKVHRKEDEDEPVQLKPSNGFDVQRKCAHCEDEEKVQMKEEAGAGGGMVAPPVVHDVINSGGQPLDASTRGFMESRFGYDFGDVQVHNDSLAHQSSADINALAYTYKNHVVFGAGQYQPNSNAGRQLLAHELTHVVQQQGESMLGLTSEKAKNSSIIQRQYVDPVCEETAEEKDDESERIKNTRYPDSKCILSAPLTGLVPKDNETPLFSHLFSNCDACIKEDYNQTPQADFVDNVSPADAFIKFINSPQRTFKTDKVNFFSKPETTVTDGSKRKTESFNVGQFTRSSGVDNIPINGNRLIPEAKPIDLSTLSEVILSRYSLLSFGRTKNKNDVSSIGVPFITNYSRRIYNLVLQGNGLQQLIRSESDKEKINTYNFIKNKWDYTQKSFENVINNTKLLKQYIIKGINKIHQMNSVNIFHDATEIQKPIEDIQRDNFREIDNDSKLRTESLEKVYDQTARNIVTIGKNGGTKAINRGLQWYNIYESALGWGDSFMGKTIKSRVEGKTDDGVLEGVNLTRRKFQARANSTDRFSNQYKWGIINEMGRAEKKIYCPLSEQKESIEASHNDASNNLSGLEGLAQLSMNDVFANNNSLSDMLRQQALVEVEHTWEETDSQLRLMKEQQLNFLLGSQDKMLKNIDQNSYHLRFNISIGLVEAVTILLQNLDIVSEWTNQDTSISPEDQEAVKKTFDIGIESGGLDLLKIKDFLITGLHKNGISFRSDINAKLLEEGKLLILLEKNFSKSTENIRQHAALVSGKIRIAAKKGFNFFKDMYETPMRRVRPDLSLKMNHSITIVGGNLCLILMDLEAGIQKGFKEEGVFDKSIICYAQEAADGEVEAYRKGLRYAKYVIIGAILGIAMVLSGGLAGLAASAAGFAAFGTAVVAMAIIGSVSSVLVGMVNNIEAGRPPFKSVLKDAALGGITGIAGGIGSFIFKARNVISFISNIGFDIGTNIVIDIAYGNGITLQGVLLGAAIGIGTGLVFHKLTSYPSIARRLPKFGSKANVNTKKSLLEETSVLEQSATVETTSATGRNTPTEIPSKMLTGNANEVDIAVSGSKAKQKTELPEELSANGISDENPLAKHETVDGHDAVVSTQGVGKCSPSPCPLLRVQYAEEIKNSPGLKEWEQEIQNLRLTDPKKAAEEADRFIRTAEAARRNTNRRPLSGINESTHVEVETAFADDASFSSGSRTEILPRRRPGSIDRVPSTDLLPLTPGQRQVGKKLIGHELDTDIKDIWRACSNSQAQRDIQEINRLWVAGDHQAARDLARETFGKWRERFFRRVGRNPALKAKFEDTGLIYQPGGKSPYFQWDDGYREALTIEHSAVRLADDPTRAVDPDNFVFSMASENEHTLERIRAGEQ